MSKDAKKSHPLELLAAPRRIRRGFSTLHFTELRTRILWTYRNEPKSFIGWQAGGCRILNAKGKSSMSTFTVAVPSELVGPLTEEAKRRGTTPEQLALEGMRAVAQPEAAKSNLLSFLGNHVGAVAGGSEPLSQDCGRTVAEGLASGLKARP